MINGGRLGLELGMVRIERFHWGKVWVGKSAQGIVSMCRWGFSMSRFGFEWGMVSMGRSGLEWRIEGMGRSGFNQRIVSMRSFRFNRRIVSMGTSDWGMVIMGRLGLDCGMSCARQIKFGFDGNIVRIGRLGFGFNWRRVTFESFSFRYCGR